MYFDVDFPSLLAGVLSDFAAVLNKNLRACFHIHGPIRKQAIWRSFISEEEDSQVVSTYYASFVGTTKTRRFFQPQESVK